MGSIILKVILMDTIAPPFGITVNGMEGGKSLLGAILSILIYIGIFVYGSISLKEIINYKTPIISHIEKNIDKGIEFHLSEDYLIAFYIPIYKDGDSLLEIHADYFRGNKTHSIYFEECNEKTEQKLYNYGTLPNFENYKLYCLNRSHLPDLEISGTDSSYSSSNINYLSISLWPREELVYNWDVNSDTYGFADFIFFTLDIVNYPSFFYIFSNTVDPEDLNQPIKSFIKIYKLDMNYSQNTKTQLFLKEYLFETDEQLIFSNKKNQLITSIDEDEIKEITVNTSSEFYKDLATIVIKSGRKRVKYSRSFKKIPDVISNISALFRTATIVFQILLSPYSNYKKNKYLMDKFLNFNYNEEGINSHAKKINSINFNNNIRVETITGNNYLIDKNKKANSVKTIQKRKKRDELKNNQKYKISLLGSEIELKNNKENSNIEEILNKNYNLKNKLIKSKSTKLSSKEYKILYLNSIVNSDNKTEIINKNKLNLSCCEKFILFIDLFNIVKCYKSNKKFSLYSKGYERIKSFFEITNVINSLNDVEKLKKLLLTPEQLALFYIGIDNNMNISICESIDKKKQNESVQNVYKYAKYLKKLKEGEYRTVIDKRLYDMLNNDIKI